VAFARSNIFKSVMASDWLMMAGTISGLGVGSLARLSRRWLNRKTYRHGGTAVSWPFFLQVSFALKRPNEINAQVFMRKF
jgi:hypothetical protein